jgi:hypothetical protein
MLRFFKFAIFCLLLIGACAAWIPAWAGSGGVEGNMIINMTDTPANAVTINATTTIKDTAVIGTGAASGGGILYLNGTSATNPTASSISDTGTGLTLTSPHTTTTGTLTLGAVKTAFATCGEKGAIAADSSGKILNCVYTPATGDTAASLTWQAPNSATPGGFYGTCTSIYNSASGIIAPSPYAPFNGAHGQGSTTNIHEPSYTFPVTDGPYQCHGNWWDRSCSGGDSGTSCACPSGFTLVNISNSTGTGTTCQQHGQGPQTCTNYTITYSSTYTCMAN